MARPTTILASIALASCGLSGQALADAPTPATEQRNPAPGRADWAAIADQPDLTGVWAPGPLDRYPPGNSSEPRWRPEIRAIYDRLKQLDADGTPQNIWVNCLPEGLPSSWVQTLNSVEFLQTPGRITILGELDGNRLRRVWLDGRPHPADPDPTFSGHSIGHWEGQTLVIDTIGFLPEVQQTVNMLANRGRIGLLGVPGSLDAALTVPILPLLTQGATVRGIVEGDSDPATFLPELLVHHRAGRLPIERFSRTYRLDEINQAIDDAHHGRAIKAILLVD